jgi:hypothetical protein
VWLLVSHRAAAADSLIEKVGQDACMLPVVFREWCGWLLSIFVAFGEFRMPWLNICQQPQGTFRSFSCKWLSQARLFTVSLPNIRLR